MIKFQKTPPKLLYKMPTRDGQPIYLSKKNDAFKFKFWFFVFDVVIKVQSVHLGHKIKH